METSPRSISRKTTPEERTRIGTREAAVIQPSNGLLRGPAFPPSLQVCGLSSPSFKSLL